uniref:Epoxyqueuosine reductase QueG (Queuosine biosynthesis) n=1 Tax=Candidatus Kentrum sp. FW TaxID=2126338 RepID=A0A450TNK9_9GAMM|nr:MAG: Epoxyqueuosine reductase QueG (queuosine biosynthesis) [Candidatus Kentron sp. FW]VFJ69407.1 MAG: Epoxyqueuosine reductase QueG (queuosine biosynthesis) [Candidatus Kentron sp. FW]
MGLLYGVETADGYQPSWWHRMFKPKVSGNTLNGLGEIQVRRPTSFYHRQDYWHPWRFVQDMFYLRRIFDGTFIWLIKSNWLEHKAPTPVAKKRIKRSPEEWSRHIKDYAVAIGVDKVGITHLKPEWVFDRDDVPKEQYIILLASRMDYEALSSSIMRRFRKTIHEVLTVYYRNHVRARKLADWVRSHGWAAYGYGYPVNTPLNLLPIAIEAGIGELGKHGSLICPEMGALFRLTYVLTDLPLAIDGRRDYGIDDYCAGCQVCVRNCPTAAIYNEKQMVRGVERWYVDFDKCVPYFNEYAGCGICVAVCPFSQPGRGPIISRKMLQRRSRKAEDPAVPHDAMAQQLHSESITAHLGSPKIWRRRLSSIRNTSSKAR